MKITASQLRAIIREEVQNARIEKMIRESVRAELMNEGIFSAIADKFADTAQAAKNLVPNKRNQSVIKNMTNFVNNVQQIQDMYKNAKSPAAKKSMLDSLKHYGDPNKLIQMDVQRAKGVVDRYNAGKYKQQPFEYVEKQFADFSTPDWMNLSASKIVDNIKDSADISEREEKRKDDYSEEKRKEEQEISRREKELRGPTVGDAKRREEEERKAGIRQEYQQGQEKKAKENERFRADRKERARSSRDEESWKGRLWGA